MDQESIVVGITGGIGAGKSVVCKIFQTLNIPVLDSDALAKELITHNPEIKNQLISIFGDQAYHQDGTYNSKYIAQLVFIDAELLKKLNAIVHPAVINHTKQWAQKHASSKYVIKEAALMIESGSYKHNKFNILVQSPIELRIKRIMERDQSSAAQIQQRIDAQMSDEEKLKYMDFRILNDEQHSLIDQVLEIHNTFMAL